jgi:transcriptional regulator with XRE-family HTH domain
MSTRERPIDRGHRSARVDRARAGLEIRTARQAAGRSLEDVGRSSGLSPSQVGRIERGVLPSVSVEQLASVGAVVGLDIRVRAYPGLDPLLDAGQAALLARLRNRIHPALSFRTEVGLPIIGDQRAWDAMIGGLRGLEGQLPLDADTRLVDSQAQIRRIMLKLRDSGFGSVLWVLADTRANRDAVATGALTILPDFPVSARGALRALAEGEHPGGSALVFT